MERMVKTDRKLSTAAGVLAVISMRGSERAIGVGGR